MNLVNPHNLKYCRMRMRSMRKRPPTPLPLWWWRMERGATRRTLSESEPISAVMVRLVLCQTAVLWLPGIFFRYENRLFLSSLVKIYGQWFHALGFSLCTTDHVYFDSRVIGSSQLEVKLKSLGSNTLCGVGCTYLAIFPSSRAAPRARCGLAIVAMAFSRRIRNCSCRVQLCYKFLFCPENEIVHFYLV